jgi:hypothetical protein
LEQKPAMSSLIWLADFHRSRTIGSRDHGRVWRAFPEIDLKLSRLPTDQRRRSRRAAMRDDKKAALGRRDFLLTAGIGTVGTAATLATPLTSPALADSESDAEKRKARYRVTDDVKAFYRVNRYPD